MTRPFHSDRMIAKFTADSVKYADCSIALEDVTTVRNPNGTPLETWYAIGVYNGRCAKALARDVEHFASRGEAAVNVWRVVLPAGVAVKLTQRVTVTILPRLGVEGAQFTAYIIGTSSPSTDEPEVITFAEERDAT